MTAPSLRRDLADHIASLTPDEFRQLKDVSDYLGEKAGKGNPSGYMAEQSVASLLNRQSPRVRQAFKMLNEVVETPREMPFAPKMSEAEIFDKLNLNPDTGTTIKSVIDGQHVADELLVRMGSDAEDELRNPSEPTTRDIIGAAYDAHTGAGE